MTTCFKDTVPGEGRLLNHFTMDSCSNSVSEVELQFNTVYLVIKVQISSLVLVLSQKKITFILPKSTISNCHLKCQKAMSFYRSSTMICPGEMHFFLLVFVLFCFVFVKTLWNSLCPLVIPTDCQTSIQVVPVCIQPLPKPGLDKVIEQPKAFTHSSLVLSIALMLATARVSHRWCKKYRPILLTGLTSQQGMPFILAYLQLRLSKDR